MRKEKRAFSSNSEFLNHLKKQNDEFDNNGDKNNLSNIRARVICHKYVHGIGYNDDFVEYIVEVITDYKRWIVKKRYSEFLELNKVLSLKMPELNKLFPPKRLFKNSEKIIEERKSFFNKYLQYLFKNKNIFTLPELLDFIQIEQKIIELYLKKHSMVKHDKDNITYKALKDHFNKITLKRKEEKSKSKSVGESLDIKMNPNTSISAKINSKEEINKNLDYFNLNKINNSIMESCDSVYEVDELNENYFSTLLDYENSNLNFQYFLTPENKAFYTKESGTIVIQEFLKNLSQNIDNKTDIVKSFEEFLKERQEWPKFSNADIIKLFTGNSQDNSNNIIRGKKWSFNMVHPGHKEDNNTGEKKSIQLQNYENELYEDDIIENISKCNSIDNKPYKGLFHYIGEFNINILLSISCLSFLVKLLDNEFNPEVELYLKLFKTRKTTDYQLMKLEEIIINKKGGFQSTNNALKLLSILAEDKSKEYIEKFLVKDETIINKLICK